MPAPIPLRDAVDDRVTGRDTGADDYLTKPFALQELLARVRVLARRRPALTPRSVTVAALQIDLAARRARRSDRPIELTAKEFALLECLAEAGGMSRPTRRFILLCGRLLRLTWSTASGSLVTSTI